MAVEQRVGQEERPLLRVEDVHGPDVVQARTDANHVLRGLHRVGILGVHACNQRIGLARFHHHHAEVVAFVHLFVCLVIRYPLAAFLRSQRLRVAYAAAFFAVVAQVDNLYPGQVDAVFLGHVGYLFLVAQQDGVANALGASLLGGFQHIDVVRLGEHHPLRVEAGFVVKAAQHGVVVPHALHQFAFVCRPVGDVLTRHARLHGRPRHRRSHRGKQARVERLGMM